MAFEKTSCLPAACSCSPAARIVSIAPSSRTYSVTNARWGASGLSAPKAGGIIAARATQKNILGVTVLSILSLCTLAGAGLPLLDSNAYPTRQRCYRQPGAQPRWTEEAILDERVDWVLDIPGFDKRAIRRYHGP